MKGVGYKSMSKERLLSALNDKIIKEIREEFYKLRDRF